LSRRHEDVVRRKLCHVRSAGLKQFRAMQPTN